VTILIGRARCKECGHIGPRDDFDNELCCPECGAKSVEVNPDVQEVKTLNDFGVEA
jgi:predicted Zn-ribbon and HTH transcriptional regulator